MLFVVPTKHSASNGLLSKVSHTAAHVYLARSSERSSHHSSPPLCGKNLAVTKSCRITESLGLNPTKKETKQTKTKASSCKGVENPSSFDQETPAPSDQSIRVVGTAAQSSLQVLCSLTRGSLPR